jgi:hypothetical protein
MFIATVVIGLLLAGMLAQSSRMKLQRNPTSVEVIHTTVGVPLSWFPRLAAIELLAAAGVVLGLAAAPFGIAAAVGGILYFVVAILAHIRVGDRGVVPPIVALGLFGAYLVLRIASA